MWKKYLSHFYFLIFLKFINCCECNLNGTDVNVHSENHTDLNLEKRQLEFEDYSTTEYYADNMTESMTEMEVTTPRYYDRIIKLNESAWENSSESYESITDIDEDTTELLENSLEVNETVIYATEESVDLNEYSSTSANETATRAERKKKTKINNSNKKLEMKCGHYKKGTTFELRKMADVWQVVFYRLPNKLKCFKLHIKLLKTKDQYRNARVYGDFNDTVRWDKCYLEIKSNEKNEGGRRRHFLQGSETDGGVMDNILIDEEHYQNTTYITLHRESADQWLVIKNLLLMRDCDNGDLVVFSRVPLEPRYEDILDALRVFGEHKPNGTMACEDKADKSWLNYEESVISRISS